MKYKEWLLKQDEDFIKEVHGDSDIPAVFKDYNNKKEISLKELQELDDKYINLNHPEDKHD